MQEQEPEQKWRVGDTVRALYREENVFYEAEVIDQGTAEGYDYLNVRFIGYGNEECVWIEGEVEPSAGPDAVAEQKINAGRFADASEVSQPFSFLSLLYHCMCTCLIC